MKSVRDVQPTWFGRSVGCWPTLPIKCESMTADGLFPLPRTGPILNMMTSSRLRQRCRIIPLLFTSYGLAWSTTCGSVSSLQVGVSQPKYVKISPADIRLLSSKMERQIFSNRGMVSDPSPLVATSIRIPSNTMTTLGSIWMHRGLTIFTRRGHRPQLSVVYANLWKDPRTLFYHRYTVLPTFWQS